MSALVRRPCDDCAQGQPCARHRGLHEANNSHPRGQRAADGRVYSSIRYDRCGCRRNSKRADEDCCDRCGELRARGYGGKLVPEPI